MYLQSKQAGVPVPTEHYRSYRRGGPGPGGATPAPAGPTPSPPPAEGPAAGPARAAEDPAPLARRLPKPINYIHASNPNLLDFDNSDFVTKPTLHVSKPKPKVSVRSLAMVSLTCTQTYCIGPCGMCSRRRTWWAS